MDNIITEAIGSTYWVKEVTANKSVSDKQKIEMNYKDKLSPVAHLKKIKALSELSDAPINLRNENAYVRTQVTVNEKGEKSIVLITINKGYREINLDGGKEEETINPVKVKRAYLTSNRINSQGY